MRFGTMVCVITVAMGGLIIGGCENAPQSGDPNQAMKTQYQEGTGVGSSSYQAKPRFYSNPNDPSPTPQPASR
jgi:hypothetical protein